MTRSRKIVWIDDNPSRRAVADTIGARFIDVRGHDVAKVVQKLLETEQQPPLVVLDHILDKTTSRDRIFQRGSTIAEAMKEKWPACPVIGVSNIQHVRDVDARTKGTYDVLFPFQDFSKYIDRIGVIRSGFTALSWTSNVTSDDLISLLKPPDDGRDRLLDALPEDLKRSADHSVASRMFRWVNRLIDRPGFLLNRLWAATLLGVNADGFDKVSPLFAKAQYRGVFTYHDEPRWWASSLVDALLRRCKVEQGEMSWQAGRRLPGIRKSHYSSCYACEEEFPEIVAFPDALSEETYAMHLRCTVLHPDYKRELYFEDIRMMAD